MYCESEKTIRKRVLLSSDYRTAFKRKSVFDIYFELTRSKWITEQPQYPKIKKFVQTTLKELSQKYDQGVVYK